AHRVRPAPEERPVGLFGAIGAAQAEPGGGEAEVALLVVGRELDGVLVGGGGVGRAAGAAVDAAGGAGDRARVVEAGEGCLDDAARLGAPAGAVERLGEGDLDARLGRRDGGGGAQLGGGAGVVSVEGGKPAAQVVGVGGGGQRAVRIRRARRAGVGAGGQHRDPEE